ncbi:MAG: hypothetical protein J6U29_02340 [Bacteroidales bacterium]|nr:hypothetical protein [Bacteroidales bacterium]
MKRFCIILIFLLSITIATAQNTNDLIDLIEKSVIEYYDTLSNSYIHRDIIIQPMYRRGELYDTNMYLGIYKGYCIIEPIGFLSKLQTPDKMPPKAFFSYGKKIQFIERTSPQSNFPWRSCRPPKLKKNKKIQALEISQVALHADTITIGVTLCYISREYRWKNGKLRRSYFTAISDGVVFDYVFSKPTQEWICIKRHFWGI